PSSPRLSVRPLEVPEAVAVDAGELRKVLVVADRPRSADDWGRFLNETLKTSEARLVVLAEGAIIEPGVCDDRHPAIARMTEVARINHVVIAAGSMVEVDPESPDHSWQTCPIIGKDGLIGSYRKRMRGAIDAKKAQEQEGPEIFSTPIGRLGVLICLDVEEDGLLFKTAQGCDIVINPAHIPYVGHGQWSHAMVPVQRRLQWWALACGVCVVRCDLRPPNGMGTSMVVTPCETFVASKASALLLPAVVPIAQSLKLRRLQSWFASRLRTEQLDNTGARVTCHLEDGGEAEWRELPCDGFGLTLRSCVEGLALSSGRQVLHVALLPHPASAVHLRDLDFRVRDVKGYVWLLRAKHNNVDVSFQDILGPEPNAQARSFLPDGAQLSL
ncbi:unnamed protein product, partial [Effrenium voratum]